MILYLYISLIYFFLIFFLYNNVLYANVYDPITINQWEEGS